MRETWETNRQQARTPKAGTKWCWGCDRFEISDGQRCPVCKKKDKKPKAHKRDFRNWS